MGGKLMGGLGIAELFEGSSVLEDERGTAHFDPATRAKTREEAGDRFARRADNVSNLAMRERQSQTGTAVFLGLIKQKACQFLRSGSGKPEVTHFGERVVVDLAKNFRHPYGSVSVMMQER